MANTDNRGAQRQQQPERHDPQGGGEPLERSAGLRDGTGAHREWTPEPAVGRVAHGIPRRVDRIKALGNAIVPQVAERIFRAIDEIDRKGSEKDAGRGQ